MPPVGPSASNCCLPGTSPVLISVPPVPSCTRGERCSLDGQGGRINKDKGGILCYGSGKLVVVRNILGSEPLLPQHNDSKLTSLVYRAHSSPVTSAKMSPSGAYVASGDEKGSIKIWAYDHEDHLPRYEQVGFLTGPIRDFSWDAESKRLAVAGQRADGDATSDCAKAIQSDAGNTLGSLSNHIKGRCCAVAFKPSRPYRIATGGKEDARIRFNQGPPFKPVPVANGVPAENAHSKGAVNCLRYNNAGTLLVSVSTDRALCVYDGKTMELKMKVDKLHKATIYSCAWSDNDQYVMTASGDGTCKIVSVSADGTKVEEVSTYKIAQEQLGKEMTKDFAPVGGIQLGCTFCGGGAAAGGDVPVSVSLNGQIAVLPKPGQELSEKMTLITGHYAAVEAGMAVDVANDAFYTGDTDGILCKWSLSTCQPTARILPADNEDLMYVVHSGAVSGLAVTGKGELLSVGWDDKLFVSTNGKANAEPVVLGAQPVAVAAGTSLAVVATVNGLFLVKNGKAASGGLMSIGYDAQAVCVTKNDKTVYVGGSDCKIYVYEASADGSTLKEKHVIENRHLKPVKALCLSHDETKLASADERDVCVLDVSNTEYKPIVSRGKWCFHTQRVTSLAWSPDDTIVASGGADDAIYLWHTGKSMKRVHYPYAHRGGVSGLHFYTGVDGLQLLSVGVDGVVNKWDVTKDAKAKFG